MAKIKICGLKRKEDIEFVNEFMPDYIGFVFANTRRKVEFERARELKELLSPEIKAVGVFVNEEIERVAWLANEGIIDVIQLHGDEDNEYIDALRKLTDREIIKAIRVKDTDAIEQGRRLKADYLLLDTFAGKDVYGGTGKTFDRKLIPDDIGDYFLAGGLGADNLEQVLSECNPYAVDLSSSVETDGFKDREKIREVIRIVKTSLVPKKFQ
ncbi:MAG: phosphoribosylanthranilate isomerase [Eubacterium sp.]